MKAAHYILSLLFTLSVTSNIDAQYLTSAYPLTATANPSAYGYDAPTPTTAEVKLSKRERQRFQRSLARRADDLAEWDLELDEREKALNGRTTRDTRRPLSRNPLPPRLLNEDKLYAWETRLDKLADRLRSKDAAVRQRELIVLRHQRALHTRDRRRLSRDRYDLDRYNNTNQCLKECCNPHAN